MKLVSERIQPEPLKLKKASFWRIGHRGFSAAAPENTLISFEKAFEAGVDMVEFDVVLSSDGVPIVLHDRTLNRTTNGKGSPKKKTYSEIKELDAGSWFGKEFRGEPIPTLGEVLHWAQGKMALNIEIKKEASTLRVKNGVEEKVLELIDQYRMQPYTVVSSFSAKVVRRLKKIDPTQSVAYLMLRHPARDVRSLLNRLKADAFHVSKKGLTEEKIQKLKAEGIPTRVYTVNNLEDMMKLAAWGVDGIYSDRADLFQAVI